MVTQIRRYLLACVIVWVIDIPWVTFVMSKLYSDLQLRSGVVVYSAILAWLLIPLGLVVFVDKISKNYSQSIVYGAVYGLVLYGVYEFTNHAVLAGWTLKLVTVDVLWGTFLCSLSAFILKFSEKRLKL